MVYIASLYYTDTVDAPVFTDWFGYEVQMTSSVPLEIDLANWMRDLPEDVKDKPLTWVSIPGSHNSGTCDLSREAGNDAFCMNIPLIARPWATCQRLSILYQLEHGIRYLDLRLDFDPNKQKFFITHFLRSKSPPIKCLESLKSFLDDHPQEVVIIDFQHFYRFSDSIKDEFLTGVLTLFGDKVCPVPSDHQHPLTISYMQQNGYQVLLINRFNSPSGSQKNRELFFGPRHFPTYWPDTDNSSKVLEIANAAHRSPFGFGYVTQLVLTLQGAKNFVYLDLRNFYKSRLQSKAMEWLRNVPGGSLPNIVITDFIDIHNFSFPLTVIKLNYLKEGETLAQVEKTPSMESKPILLPNNAEEVARFRLPRSIPAPLKI